MTQLRIPAVYMRGGTSKGVFFLAEDLPSEPQSRDRLLLRVIGSPDPYGKHIDGMGGATSSTSKVVLISKSSHPDCDVDYLYGGLAIDQPSIDWSGNCGNLTAAVGPFAISSGLVKAPSDGWATVRIWQANISKKIIAQVPMKGGEVQEEGDFELDGVTFPAAEIKLEFLDPGAGDDADAGGAMLPTGHVSDWLDVQESAASKFRWSMPACRRFLSQQKRWDSKEQNCNPKLILSRRFWRESRKSAPTVPWPWVWRHRQKKQHCGHIPQSCAS